jgi:hypothetical protein
LDLLAAKKSRTLVNLPEPWLTVCIDDVNSVRHARELVDWNWKESGMRLVISTLSPIARALKTQYGDVIEIIGVDDFRTGELRDYLELRGHDWATLPLDIRALLRKPLLARLYCDLAEDGEWWAPNEYSLFDRY